MATIIAFANQKGGVGKTTLCTTFANFLSHQGESLLLLDCDSQNSILDRRKADQAKYPDQQFNYNVQAFELAKSENVVNLMKKLKSLEGNVIIDTPGHLSQQGLIPLFAACDFVICPYQYDATTINSTITFLKFFQHLKSNIPEMKARLLLIPNRYDKRVGRKEELELWYRTAEAFSKFGEILPRIDIKADMQRYNTISLLDSQYTTVSDAYHRIYELIKQHT